MADVERWLVPAPRRRRGRRRPLLSEADPDGDFDDVDTADAEADFATFAPRSSSPAQAAAGGLDETFLHPRRDGR